MKLRLSDIASKLRRSLFVKNILIIMASTGVAQIIGFALSPIISRLFSPSDFGIWGSFGTVVGIIAAGMTLEYTQAIMLPKEEEDAINLLALSAVCTIGFSFLLSLVCLVKPTGMNGLMKTAGVWPLALLILSTMIEGLNKLSQAWAVRVKSFKRLASSQVIRSISSNGLRVGFGSLKAGASGLIISYLIGNTLASINLFRDLYSSYKKLRDRIRWSRIKQLAIEYRDFPQYAATQNVINTLSGGLPILLLVRFYGVSIGGAYAFGETVLGVPMGLITGSLRPVLFQKASENHNQGGNLYTLYFKITAGLFAIVLVPSLILIIWAPQLFSWIFGSKWYMAGEFSRSLIIWLAFVFCNLPAVLFARIVRMQRFVFFYDVVLLIARSLALIIGGLYLSAIHTILWFSIIGAVMNAFLIFRVGQTVIKKEKMINWENVIKNSSEG